MLKTKSLVVSGFIVVCSVSLHNLYALPKGAHAETSVRLFDTVPDARSKGMAGAYTAISDDAGALFYNPAGLAGIYHTEVPFQVNHLFGNIDQRYYALVYSLRDVKISNVRNPGTIAVFWGTLKQGYAPAGDENGDFISNPHSEIELMSGSYAKTLWDTDTGGTFMSGVSVKRYREEILSETVEWNTYDAGILWKYPGQPVCFGAAYENIRNNPDKAVREKNLPQNMRLGVAGKMLEGSMALDIDCMKPNDGDYIYSAGMEWYLLNPLAVRFGYTTENNNELGLTAGAGIVLRQVDIFFFFIREITVDYAFSSYRDFGDLQYFSINLKLGVD